MQIKSSTKPTSLQIVKCYRFTRPKMLVVCSPVLDQGDINGTPCSARSQIEGSRCPQQSNAIGCVVWVEWGFFEEGLHKLRKLKLLIVIRQRLLTLSWGGKYTSSLLRREPMIFTTIKQIGDIWTVKGDLQLQPIKNKKSHHSFYYSSSSYAQASRPMQVRLCKRTLL